jgi:hypothetical protein
VNPGHIAGLHEHVGQVHAHFHHRHAFGGIYGYDDDCYWQRLTEPWLPYCY